jgi:hypothetical protein
MICYDEYAYGTDENKGNIIQSTIQNNTNDSKATLKV